MTENTLFILIVTFPHNSDKPRPKTESCLFSDLPEAYFFYIFFFNHASFSFVISYSIISLEKKN